MKKVINAICVSSILVGIIGGCGLDTEGTVIPWVMTIAGMTIAVISYQISARIK